MFLLNSGFTKRLQPRRFQVHFVSRSAFSLIFCIRLNRSRKFSSRHFKRFQRMLLTTDSALGWQCAWNQNFCFFLLVYQLQNTTRSVEKHFLATMLTGCHTRTNSIVLFSVERQYLSTELIRLHSLNKKFVLNLSLNEGHHSHNESLYSVLIRVYMVVNI